MRAIRPEAISTGAHAKSLPKPNLLQTRDSRLPATSTILRGMRKKPYPLEAARVLRTRAQDAAVLVLKEGQAAVAAAEAIHARAHQDAAALAERRVEATRAAALSGAELAIAGAWAGKLQRDHAAAREVVQRTAAEVKRLARAALIAQEALRQAYIERELIERHHARFAEAEQKRIQKAEDDEMDDMIPHMKRLY